MGLRMRRCALRPVTLGRERLDARVQRLPKPEAILAGKAQKLDELSERLRRGLQDRAAAKGRALQQVAGRLSLPLLRHRVQVCDERLMRIGLTPRLLERRWMLARDALAPVNRVLPQLDPRLPLQRGYALVKSSSGAALTTREAALREGSLVIEFRDGELPVTTGEGTEAATPRPAPAKPARQSSSPPRQGDLF
jgi:exodeoxyribonuclease VII large subunit